MRPCPTLLAYGSCQEASCRLNHDVHVCTVCDVVSTSLLWHQQHLAGRQHQKRLKGRRETPQGAIHCSACDVYIPPAQWPKHLSGFKHANKTRTLAFLSVLAEATKDKHGITVSDEDGMDLGVVDLQQTESRTFTVSTHVPYSSVVLVDVKLSSGSRSS
jgi:helicase MOV-10